MRLDLKTGTLFYENWSTDEKTTVSRVIPTDLTLQDGSYRSVNDWNWAYTPEVSEDTMWKARKAWEAELRTLDQKGRSDLQWNIIKTQDPIRYNALMVRVGLRQGETPGSA